MDGLVGSCSVTFNVRHNSETTMAVLSWVLTFLSITLWIAFCPWSFAARLVALLLPATAVVLLLFRFCVSNGRVMLHDYAVTLLSFLPVLIGLTFYSAPVTWPEGETKQAHYERILKSITEKLQSNPELRNVATKLVYCGKGARIHLRGSVTNQRAHDRLIRMVRMAIGDDLNDGVLFPQ
jgi:hypothetical protein